MSLNCHGFNAGTAAYLHRACKSVDVLLLQEIWLPDVNCGKISEFLHDFDVFHTSAMEHKLSSGFRRGRPFGGTAALIRKSFSLNSYKVVMNSLCLSAVCCQFKGGNSMVFCSVYMPHDDGYKDRALEYEAVIGNMQGIFDKYIECKFVFGGDLNVTKNSSSIERVMVDDFC